MIYWFVDLIFRSSAVCMFLYVVHVCASIDWSITKYRPYSIIHSILYIHTALKSIIHTDKDKTLTHSFVPYHQISSIRIPLPLPLHPRPSVRPYYQTCLHSPTHRPSLTETNSSVGIHTSARIAEDASS